MNEKMTLLFVKHTRHVLALLTRAADAEGAAAAEELAGAALLVRYVGDTTRTFTPQANFNVPADELDAKTVDFDPDTFENPRAFSLDEENVVRPHDLTASGLAAAPPSGSTTQVKVSLTANVSDDTPVWLNVTDGTSAQTRTGQIAAGTNSVNINVAQLSPGTYYVLALVAGFPPNSFTFNIP
jgi:hypothetical protein